MDATIKQVVLIQSLKIPGGCEGSERAHLPMFQRKNEGFELGLLEQKDFVKNATLISGPFSDLKKRPRDTVTRSWPNADKTISKCV